MRVAEPFDAKSFLKNVPEKPGVYRMQGEEGYTLYVGKAKSLKKRLASYFRANVDSRKTQSLVSRIHDIELIVTHTEGEALLLENNLIKSLKPRYNILLRDDKSYPYIYLSSQEAFPRLAFHRGARKAKGRYFGPYPSSSAVRETLNLIQKLFPVRQCEDSFFRNRSRPCLQYQIKRCTAPCVGLVSEQDYADDIRHAVLFLEGQDNQIIEELVKQMETASAQLEFERAATLRDQISALQKVQERQYVSAEGGNLDVVAAHLENGVACVQVFFIREGRNLGNKSFYPKHVEDSTESEVIGAFLEQYYLASHENGRQVPGQILVSALPEEDEWLAEVISEQAGRKIRINAHPRSERARWLEMGRNNARIAVQSRLNSKASMAVRFEALAEAFSLEEIPQRIECFDISHTMGEATVASCVVFDQDGPRKSDYRRFNIEDVTPGDDYAALLQAISRRFTRLKKGEGVIPDILLIDGGKGQISQAVTALQELQIEGVSVIGIAKGPSRKPGEESLFLSGIASPFILAKDSPARHLIQQVDGEAHRFAITGHRQRRAKKRNSSILEEIEGLGPKRRQVLLKHFGGIQAIERAGVEDLARLSGISKQLAQRIYDTFHND
ncbi:MAG: excinuclease ABC subunit UvrC [Gammaproteobacteria bacterium]|nr:excinuclease ABC subunit UvrC [Gammaproteobacteria bacterium]